MTQIEQIIVTNVLSPVNAACAQLKDGSAMTLYISTYNYAERRQVTIMPQYIPDPDQPVTLDLKKINKVVMGIADPGQERTLCKQ
jgi:RNA-binding protein YlmH